MNLESIKSTLNSEVGRSLKEYLRGKLEELKSIDNVDGTVVDLKAQKKAYNKLRDILAEIMSFSEEPKVKDKRDSYNIE